MEMIKRCWLDWLMAAGIGFTVSFLMGHFVWNA